MHDIDRTQFEMGWESDEFESDEFGFEAESELYGETTMESDLSEADEMELAAELLEVSNEAELDQFIGNLIKIVSSPFKNIIRSPQGRMLGGALKGIAKKVHPITRGALGPAAGQMFGLELEGMSAEDQEFEVARRYVRLVSEATTRVAMAAPTESPQAVVQQALANVVEMRAPGLLNENSFEFANEGEGYGGTAAESPFNEIEELELAAELLSLANEAELDQFIGGLLKSAWRGLRKDGGKILRPLGAVLKPIAKKALPIVGGALGSFIPIPGVGTAVGTALGSAVSKALETELEGMNAEERKFEKARRFVRLAGAAAQKAAQLPATSEPHEAVKTMVLAAARQHVPGVFRTSKEPTEAHQHGSQPHNGRWLRRGRTIIVEGV